MSSLNANWLFIVRYNYCNDSLQHLNPRIRLNYHMTPISKRVVKSTFRDCSLGMTDLKWNVQILRGISLKIHEKTVHDKICDRLGERDVQPSSGFTSILHRCSFSVISPSALLSVQSLSVPPEETTWDAGLWNFDPANPRPETWKSITKISRRMFDFSSHCSFQGVEGVMDSTISSSPKRKSLYSWRILIDYNNK